MNLKANRIEERWRLGSFCVWLPLLLLICFASASSGQQKPLISIEAVHAIDNAQASHGTPVSIDATVTYSRGYQRILFVQDNDFAIFVAAPNSDSYTPGDRIHINGKTAPSFRPIIQANSITILRHGEIPAPVPANFGGLIRAQFDSKLVKVRAKVRAADIVTARNASQMRSARLQLTVEGGHLEAYVDNDEEAKLNSLLDAEVEITGVAAGKFDDKMQQTGVVLYAAKLGNIRVLKSAQVDPWLLPPVGMDQILSTYKVNDLSERVRVFGTITYFQPGSAIVLESGSKSLWIATQTRNQLRVGDIATATGFPSAHDRVLSLIDAEVKDTGIAAPVPPHSANYEQLAFWDSSKSVGHQFDLVSTEGEVIAEVRGALEDHYVLTVGGRLFSAIYRHPRGETKLVAMRQVPLRSRIRVTGICAVSDTSVINPGEDVPFDILLRSFDDIEVVAEPPMLSVRNLLVLVGILILLLLAVSVKAWISERRVSLQTANSAYMERKRAQILADINGTRALVEILEEITQMVSFRLRGVPSWCQIGDGIPLGNRPNNLDSFRVSEQEILDRSGAEHGTISAAIDRRTPSNKLETATLATAASLAALAIETRQLHSDLVHRSEFDQLTEIHNRFSFERYLEQTIQSAQQHPGMFAIIYIDLNDFKQVNDNHGHLIGDLYLCQVASRLRHQLRDADMLARLGGDEFAVLLSAVHNRREVEEISQRLHLAFVDPFAVEGYLLEGSASIGFAIYPEDASTKDELLSTADAAMYVVKEMRKQSRMAIPI